MSKDQMRLLKYISQVSFALTETNLYLDTHPCDKVALSYYQMVKKQREDGSAGIQREVWTASGGSGKLQGLLDMG